MGRHATGMVLFLARPAAEPAIYQRTANLARETCESDGCDVWQMLNHMLSVKAVANN